MICSGKTSNLFLTPARSSSVLLMVLISVIRGDTSCAMSLSPVEISTLEVLLRGGAGQRADDVVGLDAVTRAGWAGPCRLHRVEQRLDLRAQIVRHRRAVRLVLGEQLVAKGLAGRIEHHRDAFRVVVLQEFARSMLSTPNTAPVGSPRELRERRQRMEGAVQVRRAVDQDEIRTRVHGSARRRGVRLLLVLVLVLGSAAP